MTVWKDPGDRRPHPPWRVLLLDRDGVVIKDRGYLGDPAGVELIPGAAAAMSRAKAAGWFLVGVSNQSGLGRGMFSPADLDKVMDRLDKLLAAQGAAFDAFFYCPHAPGQGCPCRKPAAGLLEEAGLAAGLDRRSWVIGDKLSDLEFGLRLGTRAILVRTGYGAQVEQDAMDRWGRDDMVAVADDLPAAIDMVLADPGSGT